MLPQVDTRRPDAVRQACRDLWAGLPAAPESGFWVPAFTRMTRAFAGDDPGYEPLDTPYHDLEHTLQGTLCLTHLLTTWQRRRPSPPTEAQAFRLATYAILFHDTGYLRARGDNSGTGARYTRIHVQRSTEFAAKALAEFGLPPGDIAAIQSMIRCTGPTIDPATLEFPTELHRWLGRAVGTADLLGQLAAPDYPEKLPRLHREFLEAAAADPDPAAPAPPARFDDFLRATHRFWQELAAPRLRGPLGGLHELFNDPWPSGPNPYLLAIRRNLARIPTP